MENLKQKPRRSILVDGHVGEHDPKKDGRKKSIKWDEEIIEEHDKERGKTMKINEAKTPYVGEAFSDEDIQELKEEGVHDPMDNVTKENTIKNKKLGEGLNVQSLQEKLEKAALGDGKNESEEHKAEFAEKRKKHYNEGLKMKELLKRKQFEDEEEEEH